MYSYIYKRMCIFTVINRHEYWHNYYIEHKEHYKEYNKIYRKEHKKPAWYHTEYMRKYRNRAGYKAKSCERYLKHRAFLKKEIGANCCICGDDKRLIFHEVYGKTHTITFKYYREYIKDFVPMCYGCHRTLHRYFNKQEKLSPFLQKLNAGPSTG